jgi:hypothetical protein
MFFSGDILPSCKEWGTAGADAWKPLGSDGV